MMKQMKDKMSRLLLIGMMASLPLVAANAVAADAAATAVHSISEPGLQKLNGLYMADKAAAKVLNPPLKKLLGKQYSTYDEANGVQSPLEYKDGLLFAWGMMPHSGGDPSSMAFFGKNGELLVVMKADGKYSYTGDKALLNNPVVTAAIKDKFNN